MPNVYVGQASSLSLKYYAQNLQSGSSQFTTTVTMPNVFVRQVSSLSLKYYAQDLQSGSSEFSMTVTVPNVCVGQVSSLSLKYYAQNLQSGSCEFSTAVTMPDVSSRCDQHSTKRLNQLIPSRAVLPEIICVPAYQRTGEEAWPPIRSLQN